MLPVRLCLPLFYYFIFTIFCDKINYFISHIEIYKLLFSFLISK
ncbi:hypothetical protein HMPREF1870_02574 [Bacteroidales bacterium KA00344]|nr:hypothetical protein HMPREF1870_02574 [Bacteroidales bacterium KA00344]